jgi:hypothetical protein
MIPADIVLAFYISVAVLGAIAVAAGAVGLATGSQRADLWAWVIVGAVLLWLGTYLAIHQIVRML